MFLILSKSSQHYLPGVGNTDIPWYWKKIFRYAPGILSFLRILTFLYLETSTPQFNLTETGARMRRKTVDISTRYIKENAPGRRFLTLYAQLPQRFSKGY